MSFTQLEKAEKLSKTERMQVGTCTAITHSFTVKSLERYLYEFDFYEKL